MERKMVEEHPNERAAWTDDKLSETSSGELKSLRTEALQRKAAADADALEARRVAEIYDQAGEQLIRKAAELEVQATEMDAKDEADAAAEMRKGGEEMKALAEKNFNISDQKKRLALSADEKTKEAENLALRLAAQIRLRHDQWDDWQLTD